MSQHEDSLRFYINGYHHRNYVQSCQKWTNKVWSRIDLEVFGAFHRRLSLSDQTAHTKFSFDQWHTETKRFRVAIVKDTQLQTCPCCRQNIETTQHVLRCSNNPTHDKAIKDFCRRMSGEEHHPVYHFLTEGVVAWIEGGEYKNPPFKEYPKHLQESIRTAIHDQEHIRWDNALKGYVSVEWRYLAETSLYTNTTDNQAGKGISILRGILLSFHQLTQQLWKGRNHVLHVSQDMELRHIHDIKAAEIRELHSKPDQIQAGDRHFCERPIETILQKAPSSRRRWLRYMRMARTPMSADGKRQLLMTSFYHPLSTVRYYTVKELCPRGRS